MRLSEALAARLEPSDAVAIREVIGRLGLQVDMGYAIALCTGEHVARSSQPAADGMTPVDGSGMYRPVVTTAVLKHTSS